jgi:hypothetical protein
MQIHCRMPNANCRINQMRPAFSFIEVLFAVILLGIGFIMIAGIFPVAIQQTAAVSNETQGTLAVRDAIRKIQAIADATVVAPNNTNSLFPVTGTVTAPIVAPFSTAAVSNLMAAIGNDSLYSADPRFGWVGFYRRDSVSSPFAQVFVIALQNPNFSKYLTPTAPPIPIPPPIPPIIYGKTPSAPAAAGITGTFFYDSNSQSTFVQLTGFPAYSPGTAGGPNGAIGAFVLIANCPAAPNMVGRFFRLGTVFPNNPNPPTTSQAFYLQPGSDITPADNISSFSATVWLIGAAPTADAAGGFTGPYTGPNQDIAAASAFIRVNLSNN